MWGTGPLPGKANLDYDVDLPPPDGGAYLRHRQTPTDLYLPFDLVSLPRWLMRLFEEIRFSCLDFGFSHAKSYLSVFDAAKAEKRREAARQKDSIGL